MLKSDFEIKAPVRKKIIGDQINGAILFFPRYVDGVRQLQSNSLKANKEFQGGSQATFHTIKTLGVGKNYGRKDVDCHSSCNQLKIKKVWITKPLSNNGWQSEGWTNEDDPSGTGDHESYE